MKKTISKILLFIIVGRLLFQIYKNLSVPNTVGIDSGAFKALKESLNDVSSQTNVADKKVPPFKMHTSVSEAKKTMKNLILSYDNTKLTKESDNYLHFVFTTNFFYFKDDVEFYFDSENNIIDFKSLSRIDYSDMGMNRERYELIKEDFN